MVVHDVQDSAFLTPDALHSRAEYVCRQSHSKLSHFSGRGHTRYTYPVDAAIIQYFRCIDQTHPRHIVPGQMRMRNISKQGHDFQQSTAGHVWSHLPTPPTHLYKGNPPPHTLHHGLRNHILRLDQPFCMPFLAIQGLQTEPRGGKGPSDQDTVRPYATPAIYKFLAHLSFTCVEGNADVRSVSCVSSMGRRRGTLSTKAA